MKEYPHLILEKLFQRHFLFDNLTNYFPVNGFCLSKFPHYPVHKKCAQIRFVSAIQKAQKAQKVIVVLSPISHSFSKKGR